jgi:CrcB protein
VIVLLVGIGAAVGAPARFLTDRAIQNRHDSLFPWGTLCVNVVASFVLGVVVGLDVSARVTALVGTGFCGGLSTWSTLGYETLRLVEDRARWFAVLNVAGSVLAGLAAAALGWLIGAALV